jgi:hypothetical protein
LLGLRPDILQAEQQLIAAKAQIGIAKAGLLSPDFIERPMEVIRALL